MLLEKEQSIRALVHCERLPEGFAASQHGQLHHAALPELLPSPDALLPAPHTTHTRCSWQLTVWHATCHAPKQVCADCVRVRPAIDSHGTTSEAPTAEV
eukprot:363089-Chlamydomonas_euryale.AAC.4